METLFLEFGLRIAPNWLKIRKITMTLQFPDMTSTTKFFWRSKFHDPHKNPPTYLMYSPKSKIYLIYRFFTILFATNINFQNVTFQVFSMSDRCYLIVLTPDSYWPIFHSKQLNKASSLKKFTFPPQMSVVFT